MPEPQIQSLEELVSEARACRQRTKEILGKLIQKEYDASIPEVLFDYILFRKIVNSPVSESLKDECRAYFSMAEGVRPEMERMTSLKMLSQKTSTSSRHRLAVALGKGSFEEIVKRMKEDEKKMIIECDEKSGLYTFTSLAIIRYITEGHILYELCPKERSKKAEFSA